MQVLQQQHARAVLRGPLGDADHRLEQARAFQLRRARRRTGRPEPTLHARREPRQLHRDRVRRRLAHSYELPQQLGPQPERRAAAEIEAGAEELQEDATDAASDAIEDVQDNGNVPDAAQEALDNAQEELESSTP
jgi:hypothetical protein